MHIVLASKSPRRRELLELLGLRDFEIIPSREESEPDERLSPGEALEKVALSKAENVHKRVADGGAVVIGADTMVCLDGWLLGKPESREQAREMLTALSGRKHTVYTGVAMLSGQKRLSCFEKTDVYFRSLSAAEINGYIERDDPLDKAGAYAIQGLASAFVERISGDYFNVVGLPLCRTALMLKEMGIDILA